MNRGVMFTDKELDELDARFKSAMDDKFDAYNEELNARQKEIDRLRAALKGLLQDTQHRNHACGDDDCPVKIAREALRDE